MSGLIKPFRERYAAALADPQLSRSLLTFQRAWGAARQAAFDHFGSRAGLGVAEPTFGEQRERLVQAKSAVLADHRTYLERFRLAAEAAGAKVIETRSTEEAVRYIVDLCRQRGARLVAKGKTMVSEELFLNDALEAAGIRAVETDLGEWIIQLAHESPSHMVMPAIHKTRQQIGGLMEEAIGRPVSREDVGEMARVARDELRNVFATADVGITGANALIAETGTVMLITNEGNGRLTSSIPPVHVVLAGWEKLVPTFADATTQARLLARSGTAQDVTVYTTFITGPDRPDRELHILLVDNGRTAMAEDPAFVDALRCVRCAACANVCPPYQVVGGHVFGYVYTGAIGLVNTWFHHGAEAAEGPQSLCVSCNACATVCPVGIPLPRQILDVRAKVVARRGLPLAERLGLLLWSRPSLFRAALALTERLQRPLRRGRLLPLPLPSSWRWRTTPALAPRTARAALIDRELPPAPSGPLAQSGARGLTVAYFIQCISDRFAPEQADAAVRLLQACGARVVVPAAQHCCGLPAIDAGATDQARAMARQTIETLEGVQADWIVTAAASCAVAMMHDLPHLFRDEPDWRRRAEALSARTLDLTSFLARVARLTERAAAETSDGHNDRQAVGARGPERAPTVATFHSFCQSTNVLGISNLAPELLRRLTGLELRDLPEGEVCCGFGGSTSLAHPEVARQIAARKLDNVAETGASLLVTDNPGCLLHLRGAADGRGMPLRVAHLAEILSERLLGPDR